MLTLARMFARVIAALVLAGGVLSWWLGRRSLPESVLAELDWLSDHYV